MSAVRQRDTLTLDLLEHVGLWHVMRGWQAVPGVEGSARIEHLYVGDYQDARRVYEGLLRPCVVCGVACPDRLTTYRDARARRVHYRTYRCADYEACRRRRAERSRRGSSVRRTPALRRQRGPKDGRQGEQADHQEGGRMTRTHDTNVGDRVELVATDDEFTLLEPGAQGVVRFVDDVGTVHVAWDDGSSLGLIPRHDVWKVVARV